MLRQVTCDLIVKGFTFEIDSEDSDVVQSRLKEVLKLILDETEVVYESVYGVCSDDLAEDLKLANAIKWACKNHKCYLSKPLMVLDTGPEYNVPMLLKKYEAEKGKRVKYD